MRKSKMAPSEIMPVVDTAWLRMDSPENLMVINGFWVFEEELSRERFVKIISERLLAIPRFCTKPLEKNGRYYWEKVDHLEMDYHVSVAELSNGWEQAENAENSMRGFIQSLVSQPLDDNRPLWRFFHVADYEGKTAVVFRIHHAYADGMALMSVFDAIADKPVLSDSAIAEAVQSIEEPPAKSALGWLTSQVKGAAQACAFSLGWAYEAAHVALLSSDTKTALKQTLTTEKKVAWAPPISLSEVKTVGKSMDCTVNDVLLGCVAGSFRRYLESANEAVDGITLRATVPVNLRPLSEAMELGNHFGLVYLALPVEEADASKRIVSVHENMSTLKSGIQAQMSYGVLALLGRFPTPVQKAALDFFSHKATAVMTNVRGPTEAIRFDGVALTHPMFWVPQSGSIGVGVSILSYAGNVEFGVVADTALVADPTVLIEGFVAEFQALQQQVSTTESASPASLAVA